MASSTVFIFAPSDPTGESHRRLEEAGAELLLGSAGWMTPKGNNEDEIVGMAEEADALVGTSIRSSPITRRVMEASPRLRIVAKYTIGVDDVDVDAATDLGILVTHGPTESNWGGVAEGTIAMILALLKQVRERDEFVKKGGWRAEDLQGTYLGARQDGYPGITIGLVGLGRIGSRVTDLLRPWRVRVIAHDPYVPRDRFPLTGAEPVDYETLLRESDVVSFHVVLTRETRGMLGAAQLALMKRSAMLINTSRGGVVQEAALAEALEKGTVVSKSLFEHLYRKGNTLQTRRPINNGTAGHPFYERSVTQDQIAQLMQLQNLHGPPERCKPGEICNELSHVPISCEG